MLFPSYLLDFLSCLIVFGLGQNLVVIDCVRCTGIRYQYKVWFLQLLPAMWSQYYLFVVLVLLRILSVNRGPTPKTAAVPMKVA